MKTIESRDADKNFGIIADIVKSGEEVTITQNGKPTMLILPYEAGLEVSRIRRADGMKQFLDSLSDIQETPALTMKEINEI